MRSNVIAVVPAFNPDVNELKRTVNSLLEQTVGVDVCIVDDGSRDPIRPFHDERVTVLRLGKNLGITSALIQGVKFALGKDYEFICRLDVGDISYPRRVEAQLSYMRANPQVDLLGCRSKVVDLQGNFLFFHGIAGDEIAISSYLKKNAPFKHSTFFVRSSSFLKFGIYDAAFPIAQDYELTNRFSRLGIVRSIDSVLVEYVDNPSGISSKKRRKQLTARLKIQIMYGNISEISWYISVFRTLAVLVLPSGLAKMVSTYMWRSPQ